jgi:hypothetical protein
MHPAAVGVWIGHAAHNTIEHNDIFDLYYTGVSVGWRWGYDKSGAHHNSISHNHIHDLGQGVLSDMGGIYTLGPSPGTTIEGNLFHDIECFAGGYGGWGIYFDEGSTGVVAEGNVVYRTNSAGFHQHYGKENVVRNNVFAFGGQAQLMRTRAENHLSFRLEHNIVCADHAPLLASDWSGTGFELDRNLYWDTAGAPAGPMPGTSWDQWHARGQDIHSLVADPLFVNPAGGDFRLKPGSPALKLGIKPPNVRDAGRRDRTAVPAAPAAPAYPPAREPGPALPVSEDFEKTPPGEKTPDATTYEDNAEGSARVAEGIAFAGKRSLKFVKSPQTVHEYNPHVYFDAAFDSGVLAGKFALRVEHGGQFNHEWRDWSSEPYKTGPSLYIDADCNLNANGKPLGKIPAGKWAVFEIECGIGTQATGTYDLTVTLPGEKPLRHAGLPCGVPLARLTWFGFIAHGSAPGTAFYLDDVSLALKGK